MESLVDKFVTKKGYGKIHSVSHVFDLRLFYKLLHELKEKDKSYIAELGSFDLGGDNYVETGMDEKLEDLVLEWERFTISNIKNNVQKSTLNPHPSSKSPQLQSKPSNQETYLSSFISEHGFHFSQDTLKLMNENETERKLKFIYDLIMAHKRTLFQNRTFMTFTSISPIIELLGMYHADQLIEQLSSVSNREVKDLQYLDKIVVQVAPGIDEIRWRNFYKQSRFYFYEVVLISVVFGIYIYTESHYAQVALITYVVRRSFYGFSDLLRLGILVGTESLIGAAAIMLLEISIQGGNYSNQSIMIERKFLFVNLYTVICNTMAIFYGFLIAAKEIGKELSDEREKFFKVYINLQWLKNSMVVTLMPLVQRILLHFILPRLGYPIFFWARRKYLGRFFPKKSTKRVNPGSIESQLMNKRKSRRVVHDFGWNASYIIQVFFYLGFYLPFNTFSLNLICLLGAFMNFLAERHLMKALYQKSMYLTPSTVYLIVKYAFFFFALGEVFGIYNSRAFAYIIYGDELANLEDIHDNVTTLSMVSFCMLMISLMYRYECSYDKVYFRALKSLSRIVPGVPGKRHPYFRQYFDSENYREHNPFYTLKDISPT